MKFLMFCAFIPFYLWVWKIRKDYYRTPYDELPPEEQAKRRRGAVICGVCAIIGFLILFFSK